MKRTVVLILLAFCAASALSLTEDVEKFKPSATVSPAKEFDSPTSAQPNATTTTEPKTTTIKPKTTTAKPKTTTAKPKTTTAKPKTTTAKPKTTTAKPKTTTAKPKTTTAKPKTTTAKPKTTTAKPKTTTAKPKTTTVKPKTTTAKPKTTTPPSPQPTPSTNLTTGNYRLMKDKKVCLMAQMALQIRLATPKANGIFIVQPNLTTAEGYCKEAKANLTLVFKEGFITFMFNKSVANNSAYVDALSFVLSYPLSKGGNVKHAANNNSMHLFAAKIGHSYSCKGESLYMGNGLYLDVNQDRMQAFNLTQSNEFGPPDRCAADQPDYRVAIAVGVTLLVLIIIVVVAYLLGRRRRTDGYQSL